MSKRKVRKLRHRTDQLPILTFNQLSQMGTVRAKLLSGEITSEQIPPWMLGEEPPPGKPMSEEQLIHLTYNTGDQIWVAYINSKPVVVRIITHDGVYWESGMASLGRTNASGGGGAENQ